MNILKILRSKAIFLSHHITAVALGESKRTILFSDQNTEALNLSVHENHPGELFNCSYKSPTSRDCSPKSLFKQASSGPPSSSQEPWHRGFPQWWWLGVGGRKWLLQGILVWVGTNFLPQSSGLLKHSRSLPAQKLRSTLSSPFFPSFLPFLLSLICSENFPELRNGRKNCGYPQASCARARSLISLDEMVAQEISQHPGWNAVTVSS